MFEYEGTVYICADKIKEFKNLILSNCPQEQYSDIGLSILCAISIAHESKHAQQSLNYKNFEIDYQTYINSLVRALVDLKGTDKYTELSYEGEAYLEGVKYFHKKYQNGHIGSTISNEYERLLSQNSHLARQIHSHLVIGEGCKMPYIRDNNGKIVNIINYGNDFLTNKISLPYFNAISKKYPAILIGINGNQQLKKPEELMRQYATSSMIIGNSRATITDSSELIDSYIFLLLPQLTSNEYKRLSSIFGEEFMENFISNIEQHISQHLKKYKSAYKDASSRIEFARKSGIVDYTQEYLTQKYYKSTGDLNRYLQMCQKRDFDMNIGSNR